MRCSTYKRSIDENYNNNSPDLKAIRNTSVMMRQTNDMAEPVYPTTSSAFFALSFDVF